MAPSRRIRLLLLLTGVTVVVVGLADYGRAGATSKPGATASPDRAQADASRPQATESRRRRRRRPGCSRFCRQAGGFGAPPTEEPEPVRIPRQRVRVADDGIIAVRATCRLTKTCIGAILVDGRVSYGRADLRIPARATRRVLVSVPARARRHLRRRGADRRAFATVPLIYDVPVSIGTRLTILPPR